MLIGKIALAEWAMATAYPCCTLDCEAMSAFGKLKALMGVGIPSKAEELVETPKEASGSPSSSVQVEASGSSNLHGLTQRGNARPPLFEHSPEERVQPPLRGADDARGGRIHRR